MKIENGVLTDVSASDIPEDGRFIIPDGVTIIGFCAFYDCVNLTSIVIPDGVTDIGDLAFMGCPKLLSITISESVTRIGHSAFGGCSAITSATIPSIAISSIPKANLRTVVITSGTSIGDWAFSDCSALTSVTIPDSVTSIEKSAFSYCSGLKTVTIPDSVTSIGWSAFYNCTGLTSVTIPNGVTSIGGYAFAYCYGLTSVTIPNSVTSIERGAFNRCHRLNSIIIPDSVTSIGKDAFYDTPLKSVPRNYKAFEIRQDGDLVCRTKPYKLGEKSSVKGELQLCANGIHYCTNLFEIFSYYFGKYGMDFVIAECEVSKEQKRERDSGKKCARWIIPKHILTREEVIKILNGKRGKRNDNQRRSSQKGVSRRNPR